MTLLLKEWSKELKRNDKIFYENPSSIQRQMLKILNELFNQGIDYDDRKNKAVGSYT